MKKNLSILMKLLLILIFASTLVQAQPRVKFLTVASGFDLPVEIAFAGDSRIFVGENSGLIKIVNGHQVSPTPFLDLTSKTNATGNGGLLSIAFHPNYVNNGYFFVYYTEKTSALRSSGAITLARYRVSSNPDIADPNSEVIIMKILKPLNADGSVALEHNGGKLNFGKDGKLYFATGDGVEAYPGDPYLNSQNIQSLLGKMIRIDVDNFNKAPYYTVPIDNPFNYVYPAGKKEIWSAGLRNPFRWSFDKSNGDMFIADVGQDAWEEINYTAYKTPVNAFLEWLIALVSGRGETANINNYGWSCYEGTDPYNISKCNAKQNFIFPAYQYPHLTVNGKKQPASVTGGYMYRGKSIPELAGYYLAADLFSGNVYFMKKGVNGKWQTTIQTGQQTGIVTFGEDQDGELYATSFGTRELYKIVVEPVASKPNSAIVQTNSNQTNAVENVAADEQLPGASNKSFIIYPTLITAGSFKVVLNKPALSLQIIATNGISVYEKDLKNLSGTINIEVPKVSKGIYYVKILSAYKMETQRVVVQ